MPFLSLWSSLGVKKLLYPQMVKIYLLLDSSRKRLQNLMKIWKVRAPLPTLAVDTEGYFSDSTLFNHDRKVCGKDCRSA